MRYIVTLFWGILLGEVAGFLISALGGTTFDPMMSLIVSAIFTVVLFVVPVIMNHNTPAAPAKKND